MVRRVSFVVVLLSLLLNTVAKTSAMTVDESQPPRHTTYQVISTTGGVIDIAALEWIPKHPRSAILAIHGSGGVKENNWGPLSVPDYSFAHWRLREHRAVIAIDLPGYGESGGDPDKDLATIQDDVLVVQQIASVLRTRFPKLVGVGHSIGGLIVEVTQALFGSFDGIIPAAWSHGGYSEQDKANTCDPTPCANVRDILFWRKNADPQVVEDFVKPLEMFSSYEAINIGVWDGFWWRPMIGPAPDDVSALIDVPVLIILGLKDFIWDDEQLKNEHTHYPGSDDVTQILLPDTGHAVFHHLDNHVYVESLVGTWLDKRGF